MIASIFGVSGGLPQCSLLAPLTPSPPSFPPWVIAVQEPGVVAPGARAPRRRRSTRNFTNAASSSHQKNEGSKINLKIAALLATSVAGPCLQIRAQSFEQGILLRQGQGGDDLVGVVHAVANAVRPCSHARPHGPAGGPGRRATNTSTRHVGSCALP